MWVGFFKSSYKTAADGVITGLWCGCGWQQVKQRREGLSHAVQIMQTGLGAAHLSEFLGLCVKMKEMK